MDNVNIGNKTSCRKSFSLGTDRYGCQYWIFTAQAMFPLAAFVDAETRPFDPQLLVRSPDAVWKVYKCVDLKDFVSLFSPDIPNELELKNQLIDR